MQFATLLSFNKDISRIDSLKVSFRLEYVTSEATASRYLLIDSSTASEVIVLINAIRS